MHVSKEKLTSSQPNCGFTLIEISIVLVIIGLVISSVIVGGNLIRSAKLKDISSDFNKYQTIINTFTDKYDAFPGDMSNATIYWSACVDVGANTCNGNGDRQVLSGSTESYRVFEHLHHADLISSTYIYDGNVASTQPSSAFNSSVTVLDWNQTLYGKNYATNTILIASFEPFITPTEAYLIDKKIDDGNADSGKLLSTWINDSTGCVDGTYWANTSANYVLSRDTDRCWLIMLIGN